MHDYILLLSEFYYNNDRTCCATHWDLQNVSSCCYYYCYCSSWLTLSPSPPPVPASFPYSFKVLLLKCGGFWHEGVKGEDPFVIFDSFMEWHKNLWHCSIPKIRTNFVSIYLLAILLQTNQFLSFYCTFSIFAVSCIQIGRKTFVHSLTYYLISARILKRIRPFSCHTMTVVPFTKWRF